MITEDYCSYEVAKLLKKKGFDEESLYYYSPTGSMYYNVHWTERDTNWIPKPTHQMAMKWLREVHRKYIDIRYNNQNEKYRFIVFTMVKDKPIDFIHSEFHSTYEETTEAALFYVLENLI